MGNLECCASRDLNGDGEFKSKRVIVPHVPHIFNETFHGPNLKIEDEKCENF